MHVARDLAATALSSTPSPGRRRAAVNPALRLAGWLQKASLLAAASVLTLAATEGAARLLAPRPRLLDPSERIARFSPTLGWEKTPGARARIARHGEYDVEIRLNSRGLRGPDRDYQPSPG